MEEVYCIGCEEDVSDYYYTSEFDENAHGHLHCVDVYDKKLGRQEHYNTPRRNGFIEQLETTIQALVNDLTLVQSEISKSLISKKLNECKEELMIANEETYYDVIIERIKQQKRWK